MLLGLNLCTPCTSVSVLPCAFVFVLVVKSDGWIVFNIYEYYLVCMYSELVSHPRYIPISYPVPLQIHRVSLTRIELAVAFFFQREQNFKIFKISVTCSSERQDICVYTQSAVY